MCVGEPTARNPILGELAAARVTQAASFDFFAQRGRHDATRGIAGPWIDRPGDVAPLVETHAQPLGRVIVLPEWPPALVLARPDDVPRPLAVTSLTADADLRPGGGEAVACRIVILAHPSRVALGTHKVPVLIQLGPMENIVVADLLVRIEMEPTLAAFALRSAVPGERQRLQPSVGKFDQVLLQRIDAERVLGLEDGELAVMAVSLDQEFAVSTEKARAHDVVLETRIVEVAQHRLAGRMIHGELVLRIAPQLCFGAMATGACIAAHEGHILRGIVSGDIEICGD